jgi:hypothetical protein
MESFPDLVDSVSHVFLPGTEAEIVKRNAVFYVSLSLYSIEPLALLLPSSPPRFPAAQS